MNCLSIHGLLFSCLMSIVVLTGATTAQAENPISFHYDVLPVLSKQGCSSGACHGSPSGKGGFRLSLRGFDPEFDKQTITQEIFGRRVNKVSPEHSLILLKPTMLVAHSGGLRLSPDDFSYNIIKQWITEGCQVDAPSEPVCLKITLSHQSEEHQWTDRRHQLQVTAHFSDGSTRDITRISSYSSSDEKTVRVDNQGLVEAQSRGMATVLVRYLDFIATADFTFLKERDGFRWSAPAVNNRIDEIIFARLSKLQIQPSKLCRDSEFIRRIYLDLLGILPTREEVETFLAEGSKQKRNELIDRLLERPEYAEFWAQKRADLLRVRAGKIGEAGVHKFNQWLVQSVADNMPYDEFARQLLTATGNTLKTPAANYYRAAANINDCAETTSQLFLGIRIQCAKCHNHPFDRWSQDNYYGIGAFFSRVERKPVKGTEEMLIALRKQGEVTQPRTGKLMKPWLPLQGHVDVTQDQDRRAVFAKWLVSPDNPFFAPVVVNRIWGHLFGRGIVEPVDDFNAGNPPAHPDLLKHLAKKFVSSGYDQKQIIRYLLNSRVYQLSSHSNQYNEHDVKYFSHAKARMLSAEQALDAICHVTGVPERFRGLPGDMRATNLPSPDYGNDFLKRFGQPDRNTVCECERSDEPNLDRALQVINGSLIAKKIRNNRGRIGRLFDNLPGRLAAAGAPPREGCIAWFHAEADTLINNAPAADGEAISQWKNQAADRYHVYQMKENQRPKLINNAISGLPALRYDGANDFLHNEQVFLLGSGAPRTIILVGRASDTTGGALVTFGRGRTDGKSVFTAQHIKIGKTYYVYSDGVQSSGNTTAPINAFPQIRMPFITSFLSPGAGKKLQVRVNGHKLSTNQPGSIGVDKGSTGFTIGSREDLPIGNQMWNGDIAEVLIYDRALTDQQLHAVGTYLSTKFRLDTGYAKRKVPTVAKLDNQAISKNITDFYFAAYSRPPAAEELKAAIRYIEGSNDYRLALEDLMWALLNSKEFLFQH